MRAVADSPVDSRLLAARLARPVLVQVPRLLSQIDRNPHSPTYGCCARNHWHYRVEDIPNSRMQEMVLVLALAWKLDLPDNPYYHSPLLLAWIEAILDYTARMQRPGGSFDEDYRGQDSYAATASVLFCASEAVLQVGRPLAHSVRHNVRDMLERGSRWLARNRQHPAGNAVAGAAAALMNRVELDAGGGNEEDLDAVLDALEAMQTAEGWFPEWGGADIGYLSLTHGYLALIASRTRDTRASAMAAKCGAFLQHFLHRDGTVGGEYGSRNTEFLAPLGPMLLADRDEAAARLFHFLLRHPDEEHHAIVMDCLDDRYVAYLSPFSLLAAQAALTRDLSAIAEPPLLRGAVFFGKAGLWTVETPALKLVANLRKGGVFHLEIAGETYIDNGYFGNIPDGQVVANQHLDPKADISATDTTARLSSRLAVIRPATIAPWKNILLRAFSLTAPAFARRLALDFLRRETGASGETVGRVHRNIEVRDDTIEVTDFIEVTEPVLRLVLQLGKERAFSFASTGFFQPQELAADDGLLPIELEAGKVVVKRRYTAAGMDVLPA